MIAEWRNKAENPVEMWETLGKTYERLTADLRN